MKYSSSGILVVLGMHRSGTSLISNLIANAGLNLGKELLVAQDNPYGHFEDKEILQFHKDLLLSRGHSLSGLDLTVYEPFDFDEFEEKKALELLNDRKSYYHGKVWGWKDPRTVLFINEWKRLEPSLKSLIIFRHYSEVVNSLYKRDYVGTVYPTKNILKRVLWFLKFNVMAYWLKNKYLKQWILYNEYILKYAQKNKESCLVFESKQFIGQTKHAINLLNERFELSLMSSNLEGVYDDKYFSRDKSGRIYSEKLINEAEVLLESLRQLTREYK